MSGGSWNYFYMSIETISDALKKSWCLESNKKKQNLTKLQKEERKKLAKVFKDLSKVMKVIEWVDSCDSSEPEDSIAIQKFLKKYGVK